MGVPEVAFPNSPHEWRTRRETRPLTCAPFPYHEWLTTPSIPIFNVPPGGCLVVPSARGRFGRFEWAPGYSPGCRTRALPCRPSARHRYACTGRRLAMGRCRLCFGCTAGATCSVRRPRTTQCAVTSPRVSGSLSQRSSTVSRPEHRFPVPLHDCYDALTWLARQPQVDAARIAVGGASAGGGLAAALALLAHERGEVQPAFQLLAYPMLDDRTAARTDIAESNFRLWNNTSNRFGWQSYTGYPPGSVEVSGLAAPSRYDDLSGLPPASIGVGTLDLFHDEDLAYESRLREAGVKCELNIVQGAFHGFDAVRPKAGVSQAFRFSQMAALATALT